MANLIPLDCAARIAHVHPAVVLQACRAGTLKTVPLHPGGVGYPHTTRVWVEDWQRRSR